MPIVQEYFTRKTLKEIGIYGQLRDVPAWKADCFREIARAAHDHEKKEFEKSRRKRG